MFIAILGFTGAAPEVTGAIPAGEHRLKACTTLSVGAPYTVHGRLYSGSHSGSTYDIWIVGTKRILSVSWRVDPPLPKHLKKALGEWDNELYGDFLVVPLAPDEPGVRREICLVRGEHLVVKDARTNGTRRIVDGTSQREEDAAEQ